MSTISFRPTDEDRRNLAVLGETPTEAEALAADAEDRAEVGKVREFVGDTWDGIR